MESLGVYTPPPLENHDEFAQSLQLCPTSLLSLVANGLRRYVDDIKYAGRQKGLSYDLILDFCRPYDQRAADVSDLALKRRARENAHVAHSKEDLDSVSSPGGRRDSNVGGGAPVSVSTLKIATKPTSSSSELQTAETANTVNVLGKRRRRLSSRSQLQTRTLIQAYLVGFALKSGTFEAFSAVADETTCSVEAVSFCVTWRVGTLVYVETLSILQLVTSFTA